MHLSVVLLMFSLVSVCSWAHRSYTDTRPYRRASDDTCETKKCERKAGGTVRTKVCHSTTCTYNRTEAILAITPGRFYAPAKFSQIDVYAYGTDLIKHQLNIYQADYSNITFTLDAAEGKWSNLMMLSKNCSVSGLWQKSYDGNIECSLSDLILEAKDNPGSVSLDVKESEATVTVTNSSGKIWIQNSSLTLDIISSNNISLSITNCTIPERVLLSHLDHSITIHDQKECDQQLVHPFTTTTTTSTTTTTTPPITKTQAAHSLHSVAFGDSLFVTLILCCSY